MASSRISTGAVLENGAGDCDPLSLTARQLQSPLSNTRVVTVREGLDEFLGVGLSRGLLDLRVGRILPAESNVLAHRIVE